MATVIRNPLFIPKRAEYVAAVSVPHRVLINFCAVLAWQRRTQIVFGFNIHVLNKNIIPQQGTPRQHVAPRNVIVTRFAVVNSVVSQSTPRTPFIITGFGPSLIPAG